MDTVDGYMGTEALLCPAPDFGTPHARLQQPAELPTTASLLISRRRGKLLVLSIGNCAVLLIPSQQPLRYNPETIVQIILVPEEIAIEMCFRRLAILGVLAFLPAFAQVQGLSLSQESTERTARRQFGPIRDRVEYGNGTATSTNWSGYAVLGSSFTSAEGSWMVPAAVCSGVSGNEYAAFWVGIDGYSSDTVEQIGTDSDCDGTTPNYYAWYEFYPQGSREITSVPVSPGHVVSASVVYSGQGFTVTITNITTGKSYTKTSQVKKAARSSAEWIAEAPCCSSGQGILPMSDFGTVNFGMDDTKVNGTNFAADSATSGPIGNFVSLEQITKVASSSSPQTSTCGPLSEDGTSFSCTWAK